MLRIRANFNESLTRNKKVVGKKNALPKYHKTRFDSKLAFLIKLL